MRRAQIATPGDIVQAASGSAGLLPDDAPDGVLDGRPRSPSTAATLKASSRPRLDWLTVTRTAERASRAETDEHRVDRAVPRALSRLRKRSEAVALAGGSCGWPRTAPGSVKETSSEPWAQPLGRGRTPRVRHTSWHVATMQPCDRTNPTAGGSPHRLPRTPLTWECATVTNWPDGAISAECAVVGIGAPAAVPRRQSGAPPPTRPAARSHLVGLGSGAARGTQPKLRPSVPKSLVLRRPGEPRTRCRHQLARRHLRYDPL
jgi:hypothetical protein